MKIMTLSMLGLGLLLSACGANMGNQNAPASGQVVREGNRPAEARPSSPPPPGVPIMNTTPSTGPAR